MKRKILFLISLAMLTVLLAACGSKFEIEGKWKSVGDYGFGQAQPGNIVSFDGTHCIFLVPWTPTPSAKTAIHTLFVTSLLGDSLSFSVEVVVCKEKVKGKFEKNGRISISKKRVQKAGHRKTLA